MRLIGLDTMPEDGRRRGALRGTVGTTTTPGIGIRGTGTIRSTIAHGTAGAIRSTTARGIRLAIIIRGMAVDGMVEVAAIAVPVVVRGVGQASLITRARQLSVART